ncbi:MAG: CHASE2 domain-containing protein [Janthinobacterium lividum]
MKTTRKPGARRLLALLGIGPLRALALGIAGRRNLVQSRLAERVRRHRSAAVAASCAAACLYVLAAFAADMLFESAPTAAHDTILRHRLDSPAASPSIVIVDIDERALAALAPRHGRWPWSREVLAGALERIGAARARGVLFNVMMSDPDRDHPDGDALMAFVAANAANTAFPMVRLAPGNDAQSRLEVRAIPGARAAAGAGTVALLVPAFDSMQGRMGVINQLPDTDGIVRRYPVWWTEPGWALPSAALQTLAAAGIETARLPQAISLNWRNKRGGYQRISVADLLSDDPAAQRRVDVALSGAWVVLGASAPGVGQVKATPVAAVMDDNEILATALDDLLHGTWLRIPPAWLTLAITLAAIVLVGALAITQKSAAIVNNVFVGAQVAMSAVTLLCASYTSYLIDLSEPVSLLLAVFSAIKLVEAFEQKHWRGLPRYFDPGREGYQGQVHLVGYLGRQLGAVQTRLLRTRLEAAYGVRKVLCIDKLFGDEHLLREVSADYACLVVFSPDDAALREALAALSGTTALHVERHVVPAVTDVHSDRFSATLLLWIVRNASCLIEREWPRDAAVLAQGAR